VFYSNKLVGLWTAWGLKFLSGSLCCEVLHVESCDKILEANPQCADHPFQVGVPAMSHVA